MSEAVVPPSKDEIEHPKLEVKPPTQPVVPPASPAIKVTPKEPKEPLVDPTLPKVDDPDQTRRERVEKKVGLQEVYEKTNDLGAQLRILEDQIISNVSPERATELRSRIHALASHAMSIGAEPDAPFPALPVVK